MGAVKVQSATWPQSAKLPFQGGLGARCDRGALVQPVAVCPNKLGLHPIINSISTLRPFLWLQVAPAVIDLLPPTAQLPMGPHQLRLALPLLLLLLLPHLSLQTGSPPAGAVAGLPDGQYEELSKSESKCTKQWV